MKKRDTQRKRVYKSDNALIAIAAKLPEVKDMERFVKRVLGMKRVQDAFPRARLSTWLPRVEDGRGRRAAGGCAHYITMPLWSRNEAVVLHELAHTINARVNNDTAGHGWQFCSIYLTLTLHAMGREAHDALKAAFKANRVRYTAPRAKRQLTDEQRQALADRLALARLAAASERRAATEKAWWQEVA